MHTLYGPMRCCCVPVLRAGQEATAGGVREEFRELASRSLGQERLCEELAL